MKPSAELSRRERKKREVRRRIRRAAAALFGEKGYEATTVDEIAERADVAKGTFFNYFPRKDALLADLGDELLQDVEEALGPRASWRGSGREQLTKLLLTLSSRVQDNPQLFKVMIVENTRNLWLRDADETGENEFRELIASLVGEARENGEFPPAVDVDIATKLIEAAYVTTTIEALRRGSAPEVYRAELLAKVNVIYRGLGGEAVSVNGNGS